MLLFLSRQSRLTETAIDIYFVLDFEKVRKPRETFYGTKEQLSWAEDGTLIYESLRAGSSQDISVSS